MLYVCVGGDVMDLMFSVCIVRRGSVLTLYGCVTSVCCVGFECTWNVGMLQFSDYRVYAYFVEIFAHIECYSDCSRKGSHLV